MSNEAQTQPDDLPKWDEANDPDGFTQEDIRPKDYILDTFLDFIIGLDDEKPGSVSLTITTGGLVISGEVISPGDYLKRLAGLTRSASTDSLVDGLEQVWSHVNERKRERWERREKAELPQPARTFIHMRDVRIFAGKSWVDVALWRGALADITGWAPGSHNASAHAE